ncbi:multidrug effflux MFS transporter [Vibrio sp. Of7-15]|uniref:multidrug effflux MFS transporter n=1 Tax=Vibrio sp. Of7-15 TaxID=2724879 RepID=UPI001EF35D22|nr:multidrug effflux MFS transporter [Vibrio sp. Of7-15]MCG7496603.1 multidrug effflux MFS transporter [Vibrio sp. Of7-15]
MKEDKENSFNKIPLFLAMMIIATGQVGVSIYLPALPMISQDLVVGQDQVQGLVTLFLVGFGASQLFYGPLSDAIGRRPVFIFGQGLYLFGSLLCVLLADNFHALLVGRLLQGLGAGSASVLGRSVLRDSYSGAALTKALSYISVTASVLPIVAPVVGGWITWHFGWQAVFGFVLMYLLAILTLGWFVLPETLPYAVRKFNTRQVLVDYGKLMRQPQLLCNASYNWISYLAAVVSVSLFPFILQGELGLTAAEYGEVMIIPSAGLMIGSLLLNNLNKRFQTKQLMSGAFVLSALAGIWLLVLPMSLFNLIGAFTLLTIAQGITFPLALSLLLAPYSKQVGAVSALSGSVQMGVSGILGGFLVQHWVTDQESLGVFYLVVSISLMLILKLSSVLKKKEKRAERQVFN